MKSTDCTGNSASYRQYKINLSFGKCQRDLYGSPPTLFSTCFRSASNSRCESLSKMHNWHKFEAQTWFKTSLSDCFLSWIWSTLKTWRKQYWRVFVHVLFMCPKCPIDFMLWIEYGIPELEPLFTVLTVIWQLSALGPFPMSLHHIGMNVCHRYNIQKYVLKYLDYFRCCR